MKMSYPVTLNVIAKLSKIFGGIIGALLTERGLALAIFAGQPAWALVWAMARAIK